MSNQQPDQLIESILFVYGEPISRAKLAKETGLSRRAMEEGIADLTKRLTESALCIIDLDDSVQLVVRAGFAPIIEKFIKNSRKEELSRASLEVLAIVAYHGPVSRNTIEMIRGVNSAYILRSLTLRGLIDSAREKGETRYALSFDAMRELGITTKEDLPSFESIRTTIVEAEEALSADQGENHA